MGWNRSINLTVSPLNAPQGGVRGGLVVLEDISQEKRDENNAVPIHDAQRS